MRNYPVLLTIVCNLLTGISCKPTDDGKLTNDKAAVILRTVPPQTLTKRVQIWDNSFGAYVNKDIQALKANGLADYTFIPSGSGSGLRGALTEEGKKYAVNQVSGFYDLVIAKLEFAEVTGVREIPQDNTAQIEYDMEVTEITPIGKALQISDQIGQRYKYKATLVKYNDGWRLQPNR